MSVNLLIDPKGKHIILNKSLRLMAWVVPGKCSLQKAHQPKLTAYSQSLGDQERWLIKNLWSDVIRDKLIPLVVI